MCHLNSKQKKAGRTLLISNKIDLTGKISIGIKILKEKQENCREISVKLKAGSLGRSIKMIKSSKRLGRERGGIANGKE